ncbi:MAG: polysaccharide biosynthesis tyrosine autokinase [Acidocella sp.]|nr:polysaccharide biosynthesis tyrosine autokinase [Acidocella sp.]
MSLNTNFPSRPVPARPGVLSAKSMPTTELDLRDVIAILRRRKGIILSLLLLGVALAVLAVLLAQRQYSSTATIEINKDTGNGLGMVDLSGIASGLGGDNEINMDLLTEQAVILSDNTALIVMEKLKLDTQAPYAIPPSKVGKPSSLELERGLPLERAPLERDRVLAMFRQRLHVTLIKGTRLINVTYTDTDPERATAIANAVVEAYINEYTQERYQASSRASMWLAGQLADLKDKVATSQAKVDEFQRDSGLTGMTLSPTSGVQGGTAAMTPSTDNVPLERLLQLNRDLTASEVSRIAKEAIYRMTETQDPDVVLGIGSSSLASEAGSASPLAPGSADLALLQQLRQQQSQLKVQIAASNSKYGAKNPAMIQLRDEYDALDAQIKSELNRIRTRAKNDLDLATLGEEGIRKQIAAQEQEVNKVTAKADQLVLLQEEALSSRQIYQDLYTKLEEASVTAGIKASNITLVNPARKPSQPSSPKSRLSVAVGGLLGLVFGLIGAFLWDYFDDSIAGPEQVEQMTTVPVIGTIPNFAETKNITSRYGANARAEEEAGDKSSAWLLRAPRSRIAEAYRTLRTALLMSRVEHPPRVILIMSGSQAEGKSTTCLNAAAAFALQGGRVLYIDADMRRAQAHRAFNCANDGGLSNCLTSDVSYKQLLRPYPGIDSLFLLPAGPQPPNPSELIGSKRFADLLETVKQEFDYVFVDSPPVLLVTDAQLLSSHVDGYVLIVRSSKTTKRALQRSLMLMHTAGATALGIVVNALNAQMASYSGYGYYGKEGGYYVDEAQ